MQSLVKIVNPQKVLFICVDGVAPLAKLVQQRSRRYKFFLIIFKQLTIELKTLLMMNQRMKMLIILMKISNLINLSVDMIFRTSIAIVLLLELNLCRICINTWLNTSIKSLRMSLFGSHFKRYIQDIMYYFFKHYFDSFYIYFIFTLKYPYLKGIFISIIIDDI